MANPELTQKPSTWDKVAHTVVRAASSTSPERTSATRKLAQGLGWFSIGLGMAELLAPRAVARAVGLQGREGLVQAYGVREITSGIGILMSGDLKTRSTWVWSRVLGDALDLATLGAAMRRPQPSSGSPLLGILAVAGVAALDAACAPTLRFEGHAAQQTTDYSDRSGLGTSPDQARGAARHTFSTPADMRLAPQVPAESMH